MSLDGLLGLSCPELITRLPSFEWCAENERVVPSSFMFIHYQSKKPRREPDKYECVNCSGITAPSVYKLLRTGDWLTGICSLVVCGDRKFHLPMIDFDTHELLNYFEETALLSFLKRKVETETEIQNGVFMRSGPKNHYHFIGIGRLLSEQEFITFVGLALTMKYKTEDGKSITLVDARHMGHALTPFKYVAEFVPEKRISRYCYNDRFSTLRVSPKVGYDTYPFVVNAF